MPQQTLADIRAQYPQYNDMSDTQLADALYQRHYSDMPREDFYQRIGLSAETGEPRYSQVIPTDEPGLGGFVSREDDRRMRQERDDQRSREYGQNQPYASLFSPRGIAQAFNLSDELVGASAASRGLEYGPAAAAERDRVQYMRSEYPVTTAAQEFTSTLPLMAVGGGTPSIARTAAISGTLGGVAGAGDGETLEERAQGAATGAATGAAFGAAAQGLSNATGRVLSPLARAVERRFQNQGGNMTRAQRRAFAELRRAFRDDGMDANAVRQALQRYQQSGFDDATLLDVGGENVRRVVRAAGTRGGQAGESLQALLESRLETQADRVGQRLARFISDSGNFSDEAQSLIRRRAEAAAPLYNEFRQLQPIRRGIRRGYGQPQTREHEISAQLDALFETPLFARIARMARSSAATRDGVTININNEMTPDTLQRIYATLGEQRHQARIAGQTTRHADLTALMGRYRQFLDDAYGNSHRAARDAFAGESQLIDALHAGRAALRGDAEDLETIVSAMSDSERQMFRVGLVRAAREQVERARDNTDIVGRVIGNQDRRRRLMQAFDSPEDYSMFEQALRNEQSRVRNARAVAPTTGSQTAMRAIDAREEGSGLLNDLLNFDFAKAAGRVGRIGREVSSAQARRATDEALIQIATRASQAPDDVTRQMILNQAAQEHGRQFALQAQQMAARLAPPAAATATN